MVLSCSHRMGVYRRFDCDVWGLSYSNFVRIFKVNKYFYNRFLVKEENRINKTRRYVYRIDIISPRIFKKRLKDIFASLRLVRLFFLTLTYRQFRKMANKAAAKDGNFESNYCTALEGRLVSMVYRSNLLYNMFEILQFVKRENVLVNNVLVNYVNASVKVGTFMNFGLKTVKRFRSSMYKRFQTSSVLFNTPRFIYISYKLFFSIFERQPQERDLIYPFKLDIYRATAYY